LTARRFFAGTEPAGKSVRTVGIAATAMIRETVKIGPEIERRSADEVVGRAGCGSVPDSVDRSEDFAWRGSRVKRGKLRTDNGL
jgi:hypothetical protein